MGRLLIIFFLPVCCFLLASCDKENQFLTQAGVKLEFSTDTLRFDTVFTQIGSATRSIRVYNRNRQPVRLSKVRLDRGDDSKFRINVDGIPGREVEDVIIYGNDSIYVFAEVTVDPDEPLSVSPFVIEERLLFELNGESQQVVLEAWGQNANYFPNRNNRGVPVILSCNNQQISFDDPKPYVIYGAIFIDSCTLNIPPGTRIYVHGGVAQNEIFGVFNDGFLYTLPRGTLRVNGTKEQPVIFQGDRLEESFLDEEGQWTGIILGPGSTGHRIDYATVRNSIFGIYVDSAATVDLNNVQIYNTASSGLIGIHSTITATNCLIYNNLTNSVQLVHGGDYRFDYCTIASYGVDANAIGMSNFICFDDPLVCNERGIFRLNATFRNSILFGSKADQLTLADLSGGQAAGLFNLSMQNCIVRVDELLEEFDGLYANFFEEQCENCINGKREDPLFLDPNEDLYQLDSMSIALDKGFPIRFPQPIAIDLEGKLRDPGTPDLGCYELQ